MGEGSGNGSGGSTMTGDDAGNLLQKLGRIFYVLIFAVIDEETRESGEIDSLILCFTNGYGDPRWSLLSMFAMPCGMKVVNPNINCRS